MSRAPQMALAARVAEDPEPLRSAIDQVIESRRSVRRFNERPVPKRLLLDILALAGRAPSNSNMQPWRIYLAAGALKEGLARAISDAHATMPDDYQPERPMFALNMPELHEERRRRFGEIFFGALNLDRADAAGCARQSSRNFVFFDAPVAAFFTVDRRLEAASWFDCGLFAQTLMLAAKARGLDTCAQIALTKYHAVVRQHLPIKDSEIIACGMAIGYANEDAPENDINMPRLAVEDFATLIGF
jgi:nitroreductase